MPYTYSKLKGRIAEKFGTRCAFAKASTVSEQALSLKLRGKISISQMDIAKWAKLLDIAPSEYYEYFFS